MVVGTIAVLVAGALAYAADPFAGPRYRGERSDHFDGEKFFVPGAPPRRGFGDFLRWQLHSKPGFWRPYSDTRGGPPPPRTIEGGNLRVTLVNHSTTLIQTAGLNFLTDPVWSKRVGPLSWTGPARHRPPGLRLEDLPPIDVVLLSHNHYDHLDLPTLKLLAQVHKPRFIVPLGVGALLESHGLGRPAELDWWGRADLSQDVRVISAPAQHFSMRGLRDHNNTLWCSYIIEGPAGRIFFAGDTGYGPHFAEIASRYAPFRLALLPIGAYRPTWFMSFAHVSPDESARVAREIRAETSVAIHFGAFALADDGELEPVTDLHRALREGPQPAPRFWVLEYGEGRDVPAGKPQESEEVPPASAG